MFSSFPPDGFYKQGQLTITKKVLGADGGTRNSNEVFYAGIFDDKECTTLSTRTEKNILTLDLAGGSTVSESTQAVVIPDESFTLYVAETDAEGNLVGGTDGFRYAVTVENGNVLFDENNLNAEVTIINQEQPEATPTVTPEETILLRQLQAPPQVLKLVMTHQSASIWHCSLLQLSQSKKQPEDAAKRTGLTNHN